jgi:hypothetical protein
MKEGKNKMRNKYNLIVGLGLGLSTVLSGYGVYKVHTGNVNKKDKIIGIIGLIGLTSTSTYGLIKNPILESLEYYKQNKLEKELKE